VCYQVRQLRPTLTLAGLHASLCVAAQDEPTSYDRLAELCGCEYKTAAIYAAILSDGRGHQPGADLLCRISGADRRARALVLSQTGEKIAELFSTVPDTQNGRRDALQRTILPALHMAMTAAPNINMTTFCVLLYATQHNARFAYYGDPASKIAQALDITNLTRNLEKLSVANGAGLLELLKSPRDRRVTLPKLSSSGLALTANIAAKLREQMPSPVSRPKPESLERALTPEDVKKFSQGDFDAIDIESINWQ
tara:strand:- start:235 stop:993 length:759 start_codon:yes stop_codon:yes gene_type:complete